MCGHDELIKGFKDKVSVHKRFILNIALNYLKLIILMESIYCELLKNVKLQNPVILQGSVGKSHAIRSIATSLQMSERIIELHLDSQTDSKSLFGAFVCSDVPGEFVWRPGVVTDAALTGKWIVLENVDKIPLDLIASLTSLLKDRKLYLVPMGRYVDVHPSFRIFATTSLQGNWFHDDAKSCEKRNCVEVVRSVDSEQSVKIKYFKHYDWLSNKNMPSLYYFYYLWNVIHVPEPKLRDVCTILKNLFPAIIENILNDYVIPTYAMLQGINCDVGLECKETIDSAASEAPVHQHRNELRYFERPCTLNDLIKICKRIATRLMPTVNTVSKYLTEEQRVMGLIEVMEVLVMYIRDADAHRKIVKALAKCWGLTESVVESRVLSHVAEVTILDSNLYVDNRVKFVLGDGKDVDTGVVNGNNTFYSLTKQGSRLLASIAAGVASKEPILLVGETGCGKTTSIQQLAHILRKKLIVQNLSLSTDSSDLLGGYKPVSLRQLILPMHETFVTLFQGTFSQEQNAEFLQRVGTMFRKQLWKSLLKAYVKAVDSSTIKLSDKLATVSDATKEAVSLKIKEWSIFKNQVQRFQNNLPKIEQGFAFSYVTGQLVEAIKKGHWILLDEVNLASMETLQCLSGILEGQSVRLLEKGVSSDCGDVTECTSVVTRHPDFLIFAAMNPPTDVGKKELPVSLRSKFTEIYVDDIMDKQDLYKIIDGYICKFDGATTKEHSSVNINDIVETYIWCRQLALSTLSDGANQRPKYTLRTLTRSLKAAIKFVGINISPYKRALFEGFGMCFGGQLDEDSRVKLLDSLELRLLGDGAGSGALKKLIKSNRPPERPGRQSTVDQYVLVKPFWLEKATPQQVPAIDWSVKDINGVVRFVLTPAVEGNIRSIAAAVAANVAPILLQGPTSVGKTTMVEYLAALTGHKCIRINNHEQTDVEEYLGSYVTNAQGKLVYQDGLLVEAIREGCWIILDELNLAPSDVLEALNRLLDDNRELLISETGEIVHPKASFRLFATQNPPGLYGGRKPLSRAFKNRFIEISIGDLPVDEIEIIVCQACGIAPKYSKMLVKTMHELQIRRQKSSLLQGKHGSLTVRDLIKWGKRKPQTAMDVAVIGYMIIAEKLRSAEEKVGIVDVLEATCKVILDVENIYSHMGHRGTGNAVRSDVSDVSLSLTEISSLQTKLRNDEITVSGVSGIAITKAMIRMWTLVYSAMKHHEPVLLIGETGCGKTTVCQMYAASRNQRIRILNCHQSTEVMDIVGGLRPVRGREGILSETSQLVRNLYLRIVQEEDTLLDIGSCCEIYLVSCVELLNASTWIDGTALEENQIVALVGELQSLIDHILGLMEKDETVDQVSSVEHSAKWMKISSSSKMRSVHASSIKSVESKKIVRSWASDIADINTQLHRYKSLFEWVDGPLVRAMKEGDIFLLDEVNLAEDAVIERLNSVLESNREITLAEKGGLTSEKIVAHPNFRFLATMNPGGDYGKRELSPALRSRFTEIYIPNITDAEDIVLVVQEILMFEHEFLELEDLKIEGERSARRVIAKYMVEFIEWLNLETKNMFVDNVIKFSVREIISWAHFISMWKPRDSIELFTSYIQGAQMLLLDGLGMGSTSSVSKKIIGDLINLCNDKLISQCPLELARFGSVRKQVQRLVVSDSDNSVLRQSVVDTDENFGVGAFNMSKIGKVECSGKSDSAPQFVYTAGNTLRNMFRILRAMRLSRPILLEGPPGVGKSSIVTNLAQLTGHKLVRINLSEQSELSDLLGTDIPAPSTADANANSPKFIWNDGVFLSAMKRGDWVLLDELNLAPQSVLEGLNACFDHRGEVFIPEIGQTVKCPSTFRVFCAQNPMGAGGGRKGLPQSFLSRLSRVYVDSMTEKDVLEIVQEAFTPIVHVLISDFIPQMVRFMFQLHEDIVQNGKYGQCGSPWEFNLRDLYRWCQLLQTRCGTDPLKEEVECDGCTNTKIVPESILDAAMAAGHIAESAYMLFVARMRTPEDRTRIMELFESIFNIPLTVEKCPHIQMLKCDMGADVVYVGLTQVPVNFVPQLMESYVNGDNDIASTLNISSTFRAKEMELISACVSVNWPVLLVGPLSCGKRNCIRSLAQLTGNKLVEYTLTPSTDSAELLGSFEQTNVYRYLDKCVVHFELSVVSLIHFRNVLVNAAPVDAEPLGAVLDLLFEKTQSIKLLQKRVEDSDSIKLPLGTQLLALLENAFSSILACVSNVVSKLSTSHRSKHLASVVECISASVVRAKTCFATIKRIVSTIGDTDCNFEWVDGVIVTALEEGHWLLINNVNLCSASVLDRLNGLLELNGNLLLTESGTGRVVNPHKNFRIFFCMNDNSGQGAGEVSRAMRNRCVELAFLPPSNEALQLQLDAAVAVTIRDRTGSYLSTSEQEVLFHRYRDSLTTLRMGYNNEKLMEKMGHGVALLPRTVVEGLPVVLFMEKIIQKLQLNATVLGIPFNVSICECFHSVFGFSCTSSDICELDEDDCSIQAIDKLSELMLPIFQASSQKISNSQIAVSSWKELNICAVDCLDGLDGVYTNPGFLLKLLSSFENEYTSFGLWLTVLSNSHLAQKRAFDGGVQFENFKSIIKAHVQSIALGEIEDLWDTELAVYASFFRCASHGWLLACYGNASKCVTTSASVFNAFQDVGKGVMQPLVSYLQLLENDASECGIVNERFTNTLLLLFRSGLSVHYNLRYRLHIMNLTRLCGCSKSKVLNVVNKLQSWWMWSSILILDRFPIVQQESLLCCNVNATAGVEVVDNYYAYVLTKLSSTSAVGASGDLRVLIRIFELSQVVCSCVVELACSALNSSLSRQFECTKGELLSTVKHLLVTRDNLVRTVLLNGEKVFIDNKSVNNPRIALSWSDLFISVRWVSKAAKKCSASYDGLVKNNCLNKINVVLDKVYRECDEYWSNASALGVCLRSSGSSTSSLSLVATRLYKENGHAMIPIQAQDWSFILKMRFEVFCNRSLNLIHRKNNTLDGTYSIGSETVDEFKISPAIAYELLCLFTTFYWSKTHESLNRQAFENEDYTYSEANLLLSKEITRLCGSKLPRTFSKISAGSTKFKKSNEMILENFHRLLSGIVPVAASVDEVACDVVKTRKSIASDFEEIGAVVTATLSERWIISSMILVQNRLCKFILLADTVIQNCGEAVSSGVDNMSILEKLFMNDTILNILRDIKNFSSHAIQLSLHFGKFNPEYLKELQTLCWYADALEPAGDGERNGHLIPILLLSNSRHILTQLNVHIGEMCNSSIMNCMNIKTFQDGSFWNCATLNNISSAEYRICQDTESDYYDATEVFTVADEEGRATDLASTISLGINQLDKPVGIIVALQHLNLERLTCASSRLYDLLDCVNRSIAFDKSIKLIPFSLATLFKVQAKLRDIFRMEVFSANQLDSERNSSTLVPCKWETLIHLTIDVIRGCRECWELEEDTVHRSVCDVINGNVVVDEGGINHLNVATLFQRLSDLCLEERCDNIHVANLCKSILSPLLLILSNKSGTMADTVNEYQCWVYIGLFVANLVLPIAPVDPCAKYVCKMNALRRETGLLNRMTVGEHIHAILESGGDDAGFTNTMIENIACIANLERRIDNYQAKAVYRPDGSNHDDTIRAAPNFNDLFYFLKNGLHDIINSQKILTLLKKLVECCEGCDMDATFSNLREEEVAWQKSCASFLEECKELYFYYEDVTSPFVSAMYNISYGLRRLVSVAGKRCSSVEQTFAVCMEPVNVLLPMKFAYSMSPSSTSNSSVETSFVEAMCSLMIDNSVNKSGSSSLLLQLLCLQRADSYIGAKILQPSRILSERFYNPLLLNYARNYLRQEDECKAAEIEKAKTFKTKEEVYDNDEERLELEAIKQIFPQVHAVETGFKDIIDRDNERNHSPMSDKVVPSPEKSDSCPSSGSMYTNPEVLASMVSLHFRMLFLHRQKDMIINGHIWATSSQKNLFGYCDSPGEHLEQLEHFVRDDINISLSTASVLFGSIAAIEGEGLSITATSLISDVDLRGDSLLAYAIMIDSNCNGTGGGILGGLIDQSVITNSKGRERVNKKNSPQINNVNNDVSNIDRDLLWLLDPHTAGTAWRPLNFTQDANEVEAVKVAPLLYRLFEHALALLVEFPGNEMLEQICKIAIRISLYPTHTPLGLLLASLEFLSRKCDEWEQVAARHVSLITELSAINAMISKWRELELKSWRDLLRNKEQLYLKKALGHYARLQRLLSLSFGDSKEDEDFLVVVGKIMDKCGENIQGEVQARMFYPAYVFHLPPHCLKSVLTKDVPSTTTDYGRDLFNTLDGFMRSAVVGEFPARLHLLRLFACQLLGQFSSRFTHKQSKYGPLSVERLGCIVYNLWRYYEQFLPTVRKFQEILKTPIYQKLNDEIKISKWDSQNTYALIEHSEKIHRKLCKYVKEYQVDILDYPISAILQKELVGDFVDASGELKDVSLDTVPGNHAIFPNLLENDLLQGNNAAMVADGESSHDKDQPWYMTAFSKLVQCNGMVRFHEMEPSNELMESRVTLGARLQDLPKLLRRVKKHFLNYFEVNWQNSIEDAFSRKVRYGIMGAVHLEEFCDDIFQRLHSLRNSEVTVMVAVPSSEGCGLGDEGNVEAKPEMVPKVIANIVPKEFKYRSVRDLFNILKAEGISSLRSRISPEMKELVNVFSLRGILSREVVGNMEWTSSSNVAASGTVNKSDNVSIATTVLDKGELYFMRCLAELNQLRVQVSSPIHRDINMRDALLMLGYADNLFHKYLINTRAMLGASLQEHHALTVGAVEFENIIESYRSNLTFDSSSGGVTVGGKALTANVSHILQILTFVRILLTTAAGAHESAGTDASDENSTYPEVLDVESVRFVQGAVDTIMEKLSSILVDDSNKDTASVKSVQSRREGDIKVSTACECVLGVSSKHFTVDRDISSTVLDKLHIVENSKIAFEDISKRLVRLVSADVVLRVQDAFEYAVHGYKVEAKVADSKNDPVAMLNILSKSVDKFLVSIQNTIMYSGYNSCQNSRRDLLNKVGVSGIGDQMKDSDGKLQYCPMFGDAVAELKANDLSVPSSEEGGALSPMTIASYYNVSILVISSMKVHSLANQVNKMVQNVALFDMANATAEEKGVYIKVCEHVSLLLDRVAAIHQLLVEDLTVMYKSMGKFLYIVIRMFRNLLAKGICASNAEEGDGGGEGGGSSENDISKMKFDDDNEGTGLGEGDGKKDVSNEIDNEEQLLGNKENPEDDSDKQKKDNKKELSKEEKDSGVEMSQDFDGEMFDIPEDENDDQDENQEQKDEDLEREMGDAKDEDVVDEKQWGDSDDENDEDEAKQEEKFEKDSKMTGDKLDEMITKDSDSDGEEGGDEDKKPFEGKGEEDGLEEDEDDSSGSDNKKDEINEDLEDNYMDKPQGVKVQEEEKEEEMKNGEETVEDEEHVEDEEAGGLGDPMDVEDMPDDDADLPDELNLDGGEMDQEGEDLNDELDMEEDAEGEGDVPPDEDNPEMVGDAHENLEEIVGASEEEDTEDQDGEDDPDKPPDDTKNKPNADREKNRQGATFGIQSNAGNDDVLGDKKDNNDKMETDDTGNDGDEANGFEGGANETSDVTAPQQEDEKEQDSAHGGSGGGDNENSKNNSSSMPSGDNQDSRSNENSSAKQSDPSSSMQKKRHSSMQEPPNPFKSKGDMNKQWERRLNLKQSDESVEKQEPSQEKSDNGDSGEKSDPTKMYDFTIGNSNEQVLAANNNVRDVSDKVSDYRQRDESEAELDEGDDVAENAPATKTALDFPKFTHYDEVENDVDGEQNKDELHTASDEEMTNSKRKRSESDNSSDSTDKSKKRKDKNIEHVDGLDDADVEDRMDSTDEDSLVRESVDEEGLDSAFANAEFLKDGVVFNNSAAWLEEENKRDMQVDMPHHDAIDLEMAVVPSCTVNQASRDKWLRCKSETESYSVRLCEQLRLILEPTLATRLQGDYRSGKRMNMRRVIGYIASGYRKDKIWLRRTKPAKRDYKIMIMIDNSKSMKPAGDLAMESLSIITSALTRLEVGDISVVSFADRVSLLHPFGQPFTDEVGSNVHSKFNFEEETTQLASSLESVIPIFEAARTSSVSSSGSEVMQLCFIISDAKLDSDNRSSLQALIREMTEKHILVVLVVLDLSKNPSDSILNTKSVEFTGSGKLVTKSYLDNFPFPYYLAIQKVESLPDILVDTIKQWFELINSNLK